MSELGQAVENLSIDLLKLNPLLSGKEVRHYQTTEAAKPNLVTVKATVGNPRQDGVKGNDVQVEMEYHATLSESADVSDAVSDAMVASLYPPFPQPLPPSVGPFQFWYSEPEGQDSRSDEGKTRVRSRSVQIIAKLL